MRSVAIASTVACSLSWTCGWAVAQPATALDAVERSVVRVVGDSGTGSGSVVAPGWVLTNQHVVDGQTTFEVASAHTGGRRRARVAWSSEALDLAVLEVDGLTLPPVTLGTMELRTRERVWALGYPGVADQISPADDVTSTEGVIGRLHTNSWDGRAGRQLDIIQHSADINPGNSGGPLINDCGVVIGVNTAGFLSAQGMFMASRITEAVRELDRFDDISLDTTDAPCDDDAARAAAAAAAAADAAGAFGDETAAAVSAANRALWLAVGVGTVALPALLLALRKPRREVVRIVEKMSTSIRHHMGRPAGRRRAATGPRVVNSAAAPVLVLAAEGAPQILVRDTGLGRGAGGFVVGSHAPLVDSVVGHPTISRRHARVTRERRRFYIEDLNSSNGTRVNGVALEPFKPRTIAPGDDVQLGDLPVLAVQSVRP